MAQLDALRAIAVYRHQVDLDRIAQGGGLPFWDPTRER